MLDYNGSTYIRPSIVYNNSIQSQYHTKMQQSTASIYSNQSDTRYSVSKYSFKTGKAKNVYCQKTNKQDYSVQLGKNQEISFYQQEFRPRGSQIKTNEDKNKELKRNYSQNFLINRSQSCNSSIKYYKPISDPPAKSCLPYQSRQIQNSIQKQALHKLQKKKQIQEGNTLLKKSISEKKLIYVKKFSSLNWKVNVLKSEFSQQQRKMSKITSVIKQYFK